MINALNDSRIYGCHRKKGGWYVAWVREIPGVNTQGKDPAEARGNLKDALRLLLEQSRGHLNKVRC